jgi:hypothetical protein
MSVFSLKVIQIISNKNLIFFNYYYNFKTNKIRIECNVYTINIVLEIISYFKLKPCVCTNKYPYGFNLKFEIKINAKNKEKTFFFI